MWPLPSSAVTVLHPEGDSALWIGCVNGSALYSHDSFRILPLKSMTVFDFLRLGPDSMLLATPDGLKLYDGATIRPFTTGTITDSVAPECLARQGNMLWIGTSDDGVIGYNRSTRRSLVINKRAGLHSEFIYNLFLDSRGVLWAGTGFGIHSIRLEHGIPVVTFYGREQGVTGMESNHNAVLGMADGSIWFGTTNGALHYQPAAPMSVSRPPGIVMQSIQLFGEPLTDSSYFSGVSALYGVPQHLRLPYLKNNLTFSFHAISLTGDEDIQYRYRVDGLEAGWSDWSGTSSINYSSLPPGKYTLYVQCTTDGATPVRELAYSFEIITPFHKTLLFSLLLFALCILLGVTLQYIVNRRKAARLRLIDALRREEQRKVRQRTAEDFHDEVGNKLTRINVLTNVLRGKLGTITPDAERIIAQIQDNTGQLYSGTRDILWALDPNSDNLYQILCRIRDFGNDLFGDTDITFRFSGTDEQWKNYRLPMDASRNLIMIFKEALNNCLKYADATKVVLEARLEAEMLYLSLHDNGKGFNPETVKRGHGIDNMQVRTGRLNGTFTITSAPGHGSTLQLTFKLPQSTG